MNIDIARVTPPRPPDGYSPLFLDDICSPNADVPMSQYSLEDAGISREDFNKQRLAVFPDFKRVGERLTKLRGLEPDFEPGTDRVINTGNYSVRGSQGGYFITGTGTNKQEPEFDDILFVEGVDYERLVIRKTGTANPSRELFIHDLIYAAFPHVKAVTHTHNQNQLQFGLRVDQTKTPIFFATMREAVHVLDLLQRQPYVRLKEHGQFSVGSSVDEVLRLNESFVGDAKWDAMDFHFRLGIMAACAGLIGFTAMRGVYEKIADILK